MKLGSAFVAGAEVALDQAIDKAALALARAKQVLVTGLDTDVHAVRAAHRLAGTCGGVIDHARSGRIFPFLSALRHHGIVMGVPSEIRRRADRIVIVGADAAILDPDFLDDLGKAGPDLPPPNDGARHLFWLGPASAPCALPATLRPQFAACPPDRLTEALAVLRAGLKGRRHGAGPLGVADQARLLDFVRQARFGALAWQVAATDTIGNEMAAGLVDDLNEGRRFTAMPLLPPDGAYGAALVSTSVTGFPLRVSYAAGVPRHDVFAFDGVRMIAEGECDLVLAVSDSADRVAGADIAIGPGFDTDAAGIVIRAAKAADPVYYQWKLGSFGRAAERGDPEATAIHHVLGILDRRLRARIQEEERA